MHLIAVILIAAAGCCFCIAALLRWRLMGRVHAPQPGHLWPMWAGMVLLTACLALTLASASGEDFTYGVLGVWAGVASLLFVSRFLAVPSRGILVLPIGGMALLVAMAALARPEHALLGSGRGHWITTVHAVFMSLHLAAMILSGAAAGLFLIAERQLKAPTVRTLRLPNLPMLERLSERSLVIATALLLGGLATGGAAIQQSSHTIYLLRPSIFLALLTMVLLVVALALRSVGSLTRRGLAMVAVAGMLCAALGAVMQLVAAHG